MFRLSPFILLAAIGCNAALETDELTAQEELLIQTISAEEENIIQGMEEGMEGPQLFGQCKRAEFFAKKLQQFDFNSDSELQEEEVDEIKEHHKGKGKHKARRLRKLMNMLLWVYDVDQDGELSDSEKEELFADFDARCEAMHAQLLEEFDVDGDGELSDSEKLAAEEAIQARHEEHKAEREARKEEMGGEGKEGCDKKGEREGLPRFADEFDLDENGEISADELVSLRQEMRERIRTGKPFGHCYKQDEVEEGDQVEDSDSGNEENSTSGEENEDL